MENIFKNTKLRPLLAGFCAFGWSLAYPLIKIGYAEFQVGAEDIGKKMLFAGLRFIFAGLLVVLFCRLKGIKSEGDKNSASGLLLLIALAIVNTTLHYMFAYIGLGYNSSSRSIILDSMGGFFLIILSTIIFSDDKMSKNKVIGCILGILGIISINIKPGENFFADITFLGDGMILLNACCAAVGGVITRFISKKMNVIVATGSSMTLGGILLFIIGLIMGGKPDFAISVKGIIVMIILILISSLCFSVYNELLSYHPMSKIAIYNALIPVLGVIFAALLLKEQLKWQYFIAVATVAIGIYLVNGKREN